jgi:transcriptional regulator
MYDVPYFKEPDQHRVQEFMQQHPFTMLIGCMDTMPVATQVPVLIEEREGKTFIKGHIMRKTDHHKAFAQNNQVLCVFSGAHTYVSASWYTSPQTASTWNYMSVHAYGTLTFLSEECLLDILKDLTAQFENNPNSPALFEKLPQDYVQRLVKAIIGFEIEVTQTEHVFKLSQNRDAESYHNIIQQLQKSDAAAQEIAAEMEQRISQISPAL